MIFYQGKNWPISRMLSRPCPSIHRSRAAYRYSSENTQSGEPLEQLTIVPRSAIVDKIAGSTEIPSSSSSSSPREITARELCRRVRLGQRKGGGESRNSLAHSLSLSLSLSLVQGRAGGQKVSRNLVKKREGGGGAGKSDEYRWDFFTVSRAQSAPFLCPLISRRPSSSSSSI